jgi:hypothetical protein
MRFLLWFTLPIGPYASPIALSLLSLAEPSPGNVYANKGRGL